MKKFILIFVYFVLYISFACLTGQQAYSQQSITWQRLYFNYQYLPNDSRALCNADNLNFYVGGFIVDSVVNKRAGYVIKINTFGDTIWTRKVYLDIATYIYAMATTIDSGCVVTGEAGYAYAAKIDKFGNLVWQIKYDTSNTWILCFDIKSLNDNKYLMCGENIFYYSGYLLKINSNGEKIWLKEYKSNPEFVIFTVDNSNDSKYVVAGEGIQSINSPIQGFVMKLDTGGNTIWTKYYTINNQSTSIHFIRKMDHYFVVSGIYYDTTVNNNGLFMAKIDFNGNLYFNKIYHFPKEEILNAFNVIGQNKLIYSLYFQHQYSTDTFYTKIIITDTMGNILHSRINYSSNEFYDNYNVLSAIQPCKNGDIIFFGDAKFSWSGPNIYGIRTDSILNFPPIGIRPLSNTIVTKYLLLQNYPNPFNPSTKIDFQVPKSSNVKITVYDILGREVATLVNEKLSAGKYEVQWNALKFASGVYFYRIEAGQYTNVKKMVILK